MKILYFADVFAKPGRDALQKALKRFHNEYPIDFTIICGENVSHGKGIHPRMAKEFFELGVDVITTGNHAWDEKEIIPYFDLEPRLIRPANYPSPCPGRGSTLVQSRRNPEIRLGVVQVMGRTFMDPIDCPFQAADREVNAFRAQGITNIFVDLHADATSEKHAVAFYLDGRVSAVCGSHGHVQTADERVLPNGTAYITDVGMTGCFDSVIGVKKELSIQRFLSKRPQRFEPAEGPGGYGAVIVEIGPDGKALSILRFREPIA